MKKPKPQPPPDVVRFENRIPQPPPTYIAIHEFSEADVRGLREGIVPDWLRECAEWWLRDNAKPGDVPPNYQTYAEEAADADRRSA